MAPNQQYKFKKHCCHERHHIVTCSRQTVNTRVTITLFMARGYPLYNSDVI